ncbi:hypothetical protein KCU77_g10472, partial [Aureobasidium melanogenum]
MAEPPPPATMTVTVAVPMLANIFQSTYNLQTEVQNLRTEIRDLRTDFTTRIEALEAQLAWQPTTRPPPDVITDRPQDLVEDATLAHEDRVHHEEDRIDDENLHVQMDDRLDRGDLAHTQQDDIIHEDENITHEGTVTHEDVVTRNHEDLFTQTQQDDVTHEEEEIVNSSSPSVDEGITGVAEPVISLPPAAAAAGGKKRKRTIHDAPAYINRSGFMTRSSDAQLAEKRNGEAKEPSRSESPFDDNDDRDELSDGVDEIPPKAPARPQLPSMSEPRVGPRRLRAEEAGLDKFVAPKAESFTVSRLLEAETQARPRRIKLTFAAGKENPTKESAQAPQILPPPGAPVVKKSHGPKPSVPVRGEPGFVSPRRTRSDKITPFQRFGSPQLNEPDVVAVPWR